MDWDASIVAGASGFSKASEGRDLKVVIGFPDDVKELSWFSTLDGLLVRTAYFTITLPWVTEEIETFWISIPRSSAKNCLLLF